MGIYYYKLWDLMFRKGVTQKDITERAHISTATLTKMRNGGAVSLDVLDRIRGLLNCDFGDIITSKPNGDSPYVDWKNDAAAKKANGAYRISLKNYMSENELTFANVSSLTGLSLNTVKDFLKGKELSSRSILKLMRLGTDYNQKVNRLLLYGEKKNQIYCQHPCNRSKPCMGLRHQWNIETDQYDDYCLYGIKQSYDSFGELITAEDCPHPKNTREMDMETKKYGSHLRDEIRCITAKNE